MENRDTVKELITTNKKVRELYAALEALRGCYDAPCLDYLEELTKDVCRELMTERFRALPKVK
jgi:hypothetical protein